MTDILHAISNLSVQIFAIASMASIGLRYSVQEIVDPLRDFWGVVLALVANFVAVPVLALGILRWSGRTRRTRSVSFSWHQRRAPR